jgi:hypothetical protein
MSNENYYEQVARLQAAANESIAADRTNRINELASEVLDLWEEARTADNNGDHDSALYYSKEAGEKTRAWQQEMAQLPPEPQQLSQTKLNWMRQRGDLVSDPRFAQVADFWHRYVTGVMRIPEDSLSYVECMSRALEPENYQPFPTPDDIVRDLATNSKVANLGGKFTGADYNRGVQQLINARKNGYV